jgi:Methyltransferase domain
VLSATRRMQLVLLDYRVRPDCRARNAHVLERVERARPRILETVVGIVALEPFFARIPTTAPTGTTQPCWRNEWLPALDAAALYSFVANRRAKQYVEIGSGHSTRFAARARDDHGLDTRITSIDPRPRVDIEPYCDVTVPRPLESADLSVFDSLDAGDIVFLDGTHRVFQNSDATVFFTEVLPRLRRDVIIGVHDVFLPDD